MKWSVMIALGILLSVPSLPALPIRPDKQPLAKAPRFPPEVRKSIQAGVNHLRRLQRKDGSWEIDDFSVTRPGGWTALTLLALLKARVAPNDPAVEKGLTWLRKVDSKFVYVRSLQTMVFVAAGQKKDKVRIQKNVDWLLKARIMDGKTLLGWTYTLARQSPDNSNSSFAIRALYDAHQAGVKVNKNVWTEIRSLYLRTQLKDGGWVYARHHNNLSYLTMDTAGLCSLLIAGKGLKLPPEIHQQNGKAILVGKNNPIKPIRNALTLIGGRHYAIELTNRTYYNLYGLSHLGRLSGLRFFGRHEWYKDGCKFLLKEQDQVRGCWPVRGQQFDKWPLINTSFALLFLANPPK
jgi:hypothetical protein